MTEQTLKGPYETDIRVYITDGERDGQITVSLSLGEPPTQEKIDECLALARKQAEGSGYRIMSTSEFINAVIRKRLNTSGRFWSDDMWD